MLVEILMVVEKTWSTVGEDLEDSWRRPGRPPEAASPVGCYAYVDVVVLSKSVVLEMCLCGVGVDCLCCLVAC
jgi:hypothetical protein